jgi:hypothetical protein
LVIWGTWRTLDKVKVCFGVCNVICLISDMKRPLSSPTCKWSITKIGFRPRQSRKVKSNMSIHTDIQKPIHRVRRGDVADNKIGMVLLSIAADWGTEWPKKWHRWHLTFCLKGCVLDHYWVSLCLLLYCQLPCFWSLVEEPFNP